MESSHEEGVLGTAGHFLPPALSLSSEFISGSLFTCTWGNAFSLLILFRPHVSLFLSSGRLMAQYVHCECGWLVREQNRLSSVPCTPTWKMLL